MADRFRPHVLGIDDATGFVADWISRLRFEESLHALMFGGMTIAGLGLIDIEELARRLRRPVMVVNRRAVRGIRRTVLAGSPAGSARPRE